MASSQEKRCLYEILGLPRDCTADEIRSAYRKLALQRHPDKLVRSGVSEAEATASFQELVNAYEVLSDPKERAWYDSHRSKILFASSDPSSKSKSSNGGIPDLFSFFSNSVFSGYSDKGKGFYKVYGDIFDKIYQNEVKFATKMGLGMVEEPPLLGNLDSGHAQANAFYGYWLGFSTVMDFAWEDMFDAMAGMNRKSRRVMEDENQKMRKRAKREYNDTVRRLAEFAKKRDKRVIDMQKKKNDEMEKKRLMALEKKKEMEREKAERLKAYKEQEWAKLEEEEDVEEELVEEEEERNNELYCVACGKKFKSDKQWKNHEKSKKHKEKVAELREAFGDEDGEIGESVGPNGNESVSMEGEVDDLADKFEDSVEIQEPEVDGYDHGSQSAEEEEGVVDIDKGEDLKGDNDDEETSVLEKMVSGRKNRRKPKTSSKKVYVEVENEEVDLMEYNNRKGSRRNRGGRKERNKRADEDEQEEVAAETINKEEESNGHDEDPHMNEPLPSQSPAECTRDDEADNEQPGKKNASKQDAEYDNDGRGDGERPGKTKASKQAADKKVTARKDPSAKSKNVPKGRKQKASSRTSGHECETCGQDFESRNRLHKHLSDSGHATLKTH